MPFSIRYTLLMLRLIVLIIIGILVLSFFGISLQNLVHSPTTQMNFAFVWQLIVAGWNEILVLLQHSVSSLLQRLS